MLTQHDLEQFYGTEGWTRHNHILFPKALSSDGVMYLAEHGEAYWLLDAIASHEAANRTLVQAKQNDPSLANLRFWKLEVTDTKATLKCFKDSNLPPIVTQYIGNTDFPIQGVTQVWAADEGGRTLLFLPAER